MFRSVASLALVLLLASTASAQGRVTGTVKDAQGHAVKGATITGQNPDAPSGATATSDAKGRYAFLGLRNGGWTFAVSAPGFLPARSESTIRALGANAPVDFELESSGDIVSPGPMSGVDARKLQERLAAAAELEHGGKLDDAIAAYRNILKEVPALTSVHLQLGVLLERTHDTTGAVGEYQAALKADPANTKARAALDRLVRQ